MKPIGEEKDFKIKLDEFNTGTQPWLWSRSPLDPIQYRWQEQQQAPTIDYCFSKPSSDQTISNTTGTFVNLWTHYTNNDGMKDDNSNAITIQTTGIYIVSYAAVFSYDGAGERQAVLYRNNDITFTNPSGQKIKQANDAVPTSPDTVLTQSLPLYLEADDYLQIWVYHNAWWSVNILNDFTYLRVYQLQ